MSKELISIITPTWNGLDWMQQLAKSLNDRVDQWPFEWIIVDNASEDGTSDWLAQADLDLEGRLIRNEENLGFAKANNQGAEIAKGNYLLLLNNDTLVTDNFLENMLNVFSEEKAVGAVGARLVHPGKGTIQHAGVVQLSSGIPDHIHFNKPMDHPEVMKRKRYFGVTGACLMTPKKLYEELGGLDEAYVNGWEDMDYMQKLHSSGYDVYYEPTALVYHYESRTQGRYLQENKNFTTYMTRWIYGKGKSNQEN